MLFPYQGKLLKWSIMVPWHGDTAGILWISILFVQPLTLVNTVLIYSSLCTVTRIHRQVVLRHIILCLALET